MGNNKRTYRKRPYQPPGGRAPISLALRDVGEDVAKRKYAKALTKANQLLVEPTLVAEQRARVLSLVADCEFMQGRYERAAEIHMQSASGCMDHHRLWFRPLLGCVRSLLKAPHVEEAVTMAQHALDVAKTKMAQFDAEVRTANRRLAEGQSAGIPALPIRPSVVASRLAEQFMREGEPEIAQQFFAQAIEASPGGANRAKQGMAQLALAAGDCATALKLSSEAIRQGQYKAKTMPAWPVLIAARRQLGGWKIGENLVAGLDAAPADIRARTILIIATELRKHGMRQWREIADNWSRREGGRFPSVEAELRKLILASEKAKSGNLAERRSAADELLKVPGLSPQEWRMAAKEMVFSCLQDGRDPKLAILLRSARNQYGEEFVSKAAHSLALACLMAKRSDLARSLWVENIHNCQVGSRLWAQSTWALARMESAEGHHAEAATHFRRFFENSDVPARFRLQAQMLWANDMIAEGNPAALLEARALMHSVLNEVGDPEVLMNFARQLQAEAPQLSDLAGALFARGEALALQRIAEAAHPDEAIAMLFKLTRRQVIDFGRSSEAVALWESFDSTKKDWLWNESSAFWEYMGLLFEAYVRSDHVSTAVRFARDLLADPATPSRGAPCVGIPFARRLMEGGEPDEALTLFARLSKRAPTHPLCAWAWYWLALEAWRCGDRNQAKDMAANLRRAQGVEPGTLDQWKLNARGLLLLADLNPSQIDWRDTHCGVEFMHEQMHCISSDLARLSR